MICDPLSDKIHDLVAASDDERRVSALLTLTEIFGQDLPADPLFVQAIDAAYQRLVQRGARQAIIDTLNF